MSEEKDQDVEKLVEEQAKAEAGETGEDTADTELDRRNSKASTSLLIETGGRLAG